MHEREALAGVPHQILILLDCFLCRELKYLYIRQCVWITLSTRVTVCVIASPRIPGWDTLTLRLSQSSVKPFFASDERKLAIDVRVQIAHIESTDTVHR